MRRCLLILGMLACATIAHAQSGRTFYIDYSSGSNSNAGTKVSPWKSVLGMQTAAGCGGALNSGYAHQAGDHFIFKGGVTWPAACFSMTISASGSSISTVSGAGAAPTINGADYYGVDTTWFTGGSFTDPIFDMANTTPTGTTGAVIVTTGNFITLDDIEIKRNLQSGGGSSCNNGSINESGSSNIVIDRLYIHDWTIGSLANLDRNHGSGSICGATGKSNQNIYNVEMSDKATTASLPYGTCFLSNNGEVAYNNCHDVGEGWVFLHGTFHDNQIHDLDGSPASVSSGVHSNGYESDGWPSDMYNNVMYNLNVDFNSICASGKNEYIFNNAIWNSKVANIAIDDDGIRCPYATSSSQTFVYNNTNDGASTYGGSHGTITTVNRTNCTGTCNGGTVTVKNNISVTAGLSFTSSQYTVVQATNHTLTASEVSTYGFNAVNKYAPSGIDPSTASQGTNLTSTCSTISALCLDASGAPWFGGSSKPRPTGTTLWDMGAYQGQTGSPPVVSFTSPSAGTVSGSQTLTVTATPSGGATISSCQFFIDTFAFGSAVTSSPYTKSWDTTTAANAQHVLTAKCTDSNGQTGSASPAVTVTVSNSIPGCFISTDTSGTTPLSWTANQSIGTQSSNFTFTVQLTPNTANQNSVVALSQSTISSYTQAAALLRANSSGNWDAWNDTVGNYAAVSTATATAGTAYTFSGTINFTGANAGTYSLSETSPSSIVIATNYAFRSTASFASLGVLTAVGVNDTPDTVKVCNFQISGTSLTFSPTSFNFGNVTVGNTPSQIISVSSSGGATSFTSVVLTGSADWSKTNTCSGSQTTCSTTVQYAPSSAGASSATLTYTDGAQGSPQVVNLSGTGIPVASSATPKPVSVNFGNVQLSTSATAGQVIVALANGPVTFDSTPVTFDNPDFSVAAISCSGSQSGSTCQITPQVTPSVLGNRTATMTIHDNAPMAGSTQTVALLATSVNFPTPAPATQFVYTLPIQHTVPLTVNGVAVGTFADNFICELTCIPKPGFSPPWSCQCQ